MDEGEAKAKEEGALFMETSAKAGYNIKPLFRKLATALPGLQAATVATTTSNRRRLCWGVRSIALLGVHVCMGVCVCVRVLSQ